MRFPLYHRSNAIVFLDDDASYLDTLSLILPKDWPVRLFTSVNLCLTFLKEQNAAWDADMSAHQCLINGWRSGGLLIPSVLEYWRAHSQRYGLTKICVVDFSMPAMNGLDFLQLLPGYLSNRVLLTGKADELIAVQAFNDGLIDRFVPKQTQQIGKHLIKVISELQAHPMAFHDGIWSGALRRDQYAILQESSVRLALKEIVADRQWVEYFVIPAPFGILALDQFARAHWLQLELVNDLPTLADLAQATDESEDTIRQIREGTHLINTELLQALGSYENPSSRPCFSIGKSVLGAHFRVSAESTFGTSHQQYLASIPSHHIDD